MSEASPDKLNKMLDIGFGTCYYVIAVLFEMFFEN